MHCACMYVLCIGLQDRSSCKFHVICQNKHTRWFAVHVYILYTSCRLPYCCKDFHCCACRINYIIHVQCHAWTGWSCTPMHASTVCGLPSQLACSQPQLPAAGILKSRYMKCFLSIHLSIIITDLPQSLGLQHSPTHTHVQYVHTHRVMSAQYLSQQHT